MSNITNELNGTGMNSRHVVVRLNLNELTATIWECACPAALPKGRYCMVMHWEALRILQTQYLIFLRKRGRGKLG
jgi:hypothetical protein